MVARFPTCFFRLCLIGFGAFLSCTGDAGDENQFRTWTNQEGRTLDATLDFVEGDDAVLILRSGRQARVPLSQLSWEDREYVKTRRGKGLAFEIAAMPEETKIDTQIDVEGDGRRFLTPHFAFTTTEEVSRAFVMEASRVFEGTHEAMKSLPLGLAITPPDGLTHFEATFLNQAEFSEVLRTTTGKSAARGVAGVYVTSEKKVFVPYDQLGVVRNGSRLTLRKTSDTSTLIHEISHQLMHDWLPLIPIWMSEGMAEYLASVPYQSGRFEFRNADRGLKERITSRLQDADSPLVIRNPGKILPGNRETWQGTARDYQEGLLYVYYFMHLDRPESPGAPFAAYFRLIDEARNDTRRMIEEYNAAVRSYQSKVSAYNQQAQKFETEYAAYEAALAAYNSRVDQYNQQVVDGVSEDARVELGIEPDAPEPPVQPVVPEILENTSIDGPIDLFQAVNDHARPALLRGRDYEEIARRMEKAYSGMGFSVMFEE